MANTETNKKDGEFAVPKRGVLWIIIGFAVMVIGYALMTGGGSSNPDEFSEAIFSFRRIVLAPVVIIAGAVVVAAAIMKKK